ncbi:MAG: 23S rRNA (uracil(1939)-C(5))-methyltransferase RlmD [Magnetococcales bacterium]|nr:23S rRNA (uracil(1939)-C(5))-methyltransferase RlmD [Magnetococcales bacterium]
MDLFTLKIERWVTGGRGLGHKDGLAVFVPGSVPGDLLQVRLTSRRRNHASAAIAAIVQPGPGRIVPHCPHFGICGGCQLQHMDDTHQLRFKKDVVTDTLTRIGRFGSGLPVADVGQVSPRWNYRRKASFKVRVVQDRTLLGFHQTGSHRVVDIAHCPILRPELAALMAPLRSLITKLAIRSQIPQLDVMMGDAGIGLLMHVLGPLAGADRERCLEFAQDHHLSRLDLQQGRKDRLTSLVQMGPLEYHLEGMICKFLPADFIQVNGEGNVNLVALAMASVDPGGMAWDLFSGIGNFTLPLARRHRNVLAVEGHRSSLERLRLNSRRAGIESIHTLHADLFSEAGVEALAKQSTPELILMDPPREGAAVVCRNIERYQPRRLIYISCDPATFSRDAAILRHLGGQLRHVAPVDLFPQTFHVELVAQFDWQ